MIASVFVNKKKVIITYINQINMSISIRIHWVKIKKTLNLIYYLESYLQYNILAIIYRYVKNGNILYIVYK